MNFARRLFMKKAAGAAAAAPLLPHHMMDQMKQQQIHGVGIPTSAYGFGSSSPMDLLKKAARELYQRKDQENRDHVIYRQGPFDPDIAVIRSTSYAFKKQQQIKRDRKTRSFMDKLHKDGWSD